MSTRKAMITVKRAVSDVLGGLCVERQEGQGLVEYALIILLVVVVTVGAVGGFGSAVNSLYEKVLPKLAL